MANTKQARKRARQAEKNRQHNASLRSMMRTYIKNVRVAIEDGNKDTAKTAFSKMEKVVDRFSDKGLIHDNKAARYKSRLSAQIKAMS